MTSVNVTTQNNTVTVQEGDATTVTVTTQGPQGATGAGITAGDKGSLTVAANLTDWTLNDSVVTSAKITDGAIVNADINASAAIAQSKLDIANATTSASGFMSGSDKTKLDGIETGATADQTASEIVALVADQTIAPSEIDMEDNEKIKLGTGDDLTIVHDGSDSKITNKTGNLLIEAKDGETGIKVIPDGNVELYHDNVKRCETSADGFDLPDNSKLQLGDSQDLAIFHDGSNSRIQDSGTGFLLLDTNTLMIRKVDGSETMAKFVANGAAELYFDNVKKAETSANGFDLTGNLNLLDSSSSSVGRVMLGTDSDLQISHTGSGGIIGNYTGTLGIRSNALRLQNGAGTESYIKADENGAVELYYDSSKKFETTSSGVTVTGSVTASTGILFGSDTADANTLDDYEEGTWTPTVLSGGTIGTSQYTSTYTKIGRLVTINTDIHQLSDITSSTNIAIGGLPYVPSGTDGNWSAVCHGERYDSADIIVAFLQYTGGSWKITFRKGVGVNGYSDLKHSDINNAGDNNLRFTLTYELTT